MVAKHFGRHYSLEHLRQLSYIDREGASLMGISDAAESIGLRTLGVKTGIERLKSNIPLPCIAHWQQDHFVVVYRVRGRKIYVADPRVGNRFLDEQLFMNGWISDVFNGEPQGVLLLLETTPKFFSLGGEKAQRSGFRFLWTYLRQYRHLMVQLLLGLIIGSLIQLLFPFLMQAMVDKGVQLDNLNFVYLILAAQGMLFLSQVAVEYIRGWILLHIGARININLVSDFLTKFMKLPMSYFDAKMTGDLMQRIYDNERIERFLTSSSLTVLFSAVNLLIFGSVLLYFSPILFGVFIIGSGLYFGWVALFLQRRRELDFRRFENIAENQGSLLELVNGMQEIKLHNAERQKRWVWERVQVRLHRTNVQYLANDQFQRAGAAFINEGKNILLSIIAATSVIQGDLTLGMMLAVQYIIGHMNAPLESMVQFMLAAQEAKISLERMAEIHNRPEEPGDRGGEGFALEGSLHVRDLSFRYGGPHSPFVLKQVNLEIKKNHITAIVGTSGSGKTTLMKLLLNFYPPTLGVVALGDTELGAANHHFWRSQCGAVLQDGYVFSDTIARNIAMGVEQVDISKLHAAAQVANLAQFVESLPLGFNTKIGRDGLGLSQGQRQRLLIARAVYKDPAYLFFDEATNALDAHNEKIILSNLGAVFQNRTVVVVAHRLSTVRAAHHIVVLEKGEVVEQGSHQSLVDKKGAYYHLISDQLELGV
jgi:ATP-binding cassette subfamily B protein